MPEFGDVVRRRRMTRAFSDTPVAADALEELVDLAARAPSAGKTQGWHLVVLEGPQTSRFWDITLPAVRRDSFRWKRLLSAPIIALPLADAKAYTDRYSEPDKAQTGLGVGPDAWPAPYWTIDASMSVMTLLLAAEAAGLGALFFGVFRGERELRRALDIPTGLELLGAIALGHPVEEVTAAAEAATRPRDAAGDGASHVGRSAARPRRRSAEIIHSGRW
ncbi:MAG: nitroreductase family protein [Acidimicrobiia bacterium]|nr:nitroreductase family protein [Acidimicrobiia bacterium]